MITRSNLAEQLREYQLRSKHDWAFVSFFSSTSNLSSYSCASWVQGGCYGLCYMGTFHFGFPGFCSRFFIF
ncbi:hypothetical protein V6N12_028655 [Hibiscus sabdariffa]|uniref:Uncharacterized protein n=1 Tax=Hibiscus sabdariffa TaxID=183260 RepID=A0ABR2F6G1_9ROSI